MSEIAAHRPRALVVDDSQIARYILSGHLDRLGFEFEVADSAEAALKQLSVGLPDIVFMDHLLPGIDGLEAVRMLRAESRTATLPIVMYTSQEGEAFAREADAAGADDIYSKMSDDSALARILERLDLLPDQPGQKVRPPNVVSLESRQPTRSPATSQRASITRAELTRLLEPSLEAHHAKLHQELLAEFAILERYEERMRRDFFSRVDMLAQQTTGRVDDALANERAEHRRDRRRRRIGSLALAAAVLLSLAVNALLSWQTGQRSGELGTSAVSTIEAVVNNTLAIEALRYDIHQLGVDRAGTLPASGFEVRQAAMPLPDPPAPSPGAAEALVAELQSMGILGPVRIETEAGSFCVTATLDGLEFLGANVALRDCQSLPVQLTANSLR
jgi:CheY-like chemotaxis protein